MRDILIDNHKQSELSSLGYTVIDLLNEEEVIGLNSIYNELHPDGNVPHYIDGIHMTTWCPEKDYKLRVKTSLETFFAHKVNQTFDKVNVVNNVFIVKKPGETTFKVHQDWSVVDESKYYALNVWVPLHDVDEENGAMWLLKGSHKINRKIRGAGYLFPNYAPHFDTLEQYATLIPLKAGQAVIFNTSMIHGSPANLSNEHRRAAVFTVFHKEADMTIYFQKDAKHNLEVHTPDMDFMYNYNSLRTDTFESGPTENPEIRQHSIINHPVDIDELSPFLK